MKKLLLIVLTLFSVSCYGAKIVSDSTTQSVTHCGFVIDTLAKVDVPVAIDTSGNPFCSYDVSNVSVGSHSAKATFVRIDPVWGRVAESAFSNTLNFTKPDVGGIINLSPSGLKLVP